MGILDIAELVGTIVGTLGTLVGLFKVRQERRRSGRHRFWSRWTVVISIFILLLAAIVVLFSVRLAGDSATEVSIVYPSDGATVELAEVVQGESQSVPSSSKVWVVVFIASLGRYYPNLYPVDTDSSGNWSCLTYFGRPGDTGDFDLLAVLADEPAQESFRQYADRAVSAGAYDGVAVLPKGAVVEDQAAVTRR